MTCRNHNAHAKPDGDEVIEQLHLLVGQGIRAMIPTHHLDRRREGISLLKNGVSGAHRQFTHGARLHQIPEIDHSRDLPTVSLDPGHEDVIVIPVVVDDASA